MSGCTCRLLRGPPARLPAHHGGRGAGAQGTHLVRSERAPSTFLAAPPAMGLLLGESHRRGDSSLNPKTDVGWGGPPQPGEALMRGGFWGT